jgi:hypothetical protein
MSRGVGFSFQDPEAVAERCGRTCVYSYHVSVAVDFGFGAVG